ncbi:hypothetical protein LSH36_1949g00000, partial [Paralvinella palmiformis]
MSDLSTPRRSKRSRDNQSNPATPSRRGTKTGTNTPVSTREML